ncbi:MAG: cytochrome C oxidase subunit II [Thermoleophilia bacterium]|nr:cytochrome C oxidase subunit II [Thermoleophilia bacterium]
MNPTALTILIAYSAVTILALAAVLWIWKSTHSFDRDRKDEVDTHKLVEGEKGWFIFAVITLGILALATLAFIPYGDNAAAKGQQQVSVEGQQFAWVMNPGTIEAGTPVRFKVTAKDVNHGFGVYNDDNVMLFQIQAVPDSVSHIVYTFKVPGRYQVVCMEFCGVNHHNMIGQFQVEAAK